MSLGIDRSKFGDIRVEDGAIQFVVALEVLDYVRANFTSIGKVKVHIDDSRKSTRLFCSTGRMDD